MGDRFTISETPLRGLRVVTRKPIGDHRGYLERLFCEDEFSTLLEDRKIVQINQTYTAQCGTVRGMHFQKPPYAETKMVSCLEGEVYDVAVDLRRNSPTFLKVHGEILSSENHKTLLIPEGFAHGFQTLTDDCKMLYFHTASYNSEAEGGVRPTDPKLAIAWPLPLAEVSERDASHSLIDELFAGLEV